MGLNGIYVNLAGRERAGIVHTGGTRDRSMEQVREAIAGTARSFGWSSGRGSGRMN